VRRWQRNWIVGSMTLGVPEKSDHESSDRF
jgi:hypothetical protein